MLQTIREHTQGWIAGIIITLIILSFALWGIHSYFVGDPNTGVVAEVNGVSISREQLSVAYDRLRRQTQAQFGANNPYTSKSEAALKERALQALIDIEVLKQASSAQNFRISDAQIDNYFESMPEFQVDGRFSQERFQEVLASTLLSTSEFLDLIRTSLLIDQPKLGIIFTSFALPTETDATLALVNQERALQYINIPLQYFLAQPTLISANAIKAYYTQHKNEFMTPEQVSIDYIELSLRDISEKIVPTDMMLKNFYNENINSYTQPLAWKLNDIEIPIPDNATPQDIQTAAKKAEEVSAALAKGEDFTKLTQNYISNLTPKDWLTLNQVPAELQKAVANLNKPGQVSPIIKTQKAFIVIKAIDIRDPKIETFDTVKEKVKEAYVRQHAEEKLAELRDQLADATYEHPDSLQWAAKSLNLPIKTSSLFSKDKSGSDISQSKKIRDIAFSNDVLNLQNNSDIIQLNPETMIVLRIKSHVASTLLPLNNVAAQITNTLKTQTAEKQAEIFANDLQKKLQAGNDPHAIATAAHLNVVETGYIGRYSRKVDSAILDTAFRLANPATVHAKVVYGITRLPNGYAIVGLQGVKDGTVTDAKQYAVFAEQVQNSEGLLEYELYKQSQTQAAKIKIGG